MTETPDPKHVSEALTDPAALVGDLGDGRKTEVQNRDLASEVAGLEDAIDEAVIADKAGHDLDPAKIAELQRAHLEARSQQNTTPDQ